MRDIRLAVRRLAAAPAFTIAAVLILALGIGANTLTFSALRGMLVAPLPFSDADRIAWISARDARTGIPDDSVSPEETAALARLTSVEAASNLGARALVRPDGVRRVEWRGLWVTPGLFKVLGVTPALGRAFAAEDMPRGAAPAMVIGYERWQRDLGGDPSVIGTVLRFADNKAFTVVGILPRGLEFPFGRTPGSSTGAGYSAGVQDFWVIGQDRLDEFPGGTTVVRGRDGVTPRQLSAEAATTAAAGRSFSVVSLRDHALGLLRPALPLLQGFAALVLLIACANLGNLLLARAAKARTEFAVRAALGAGRIDLLRILVAESLVLSVAGAAAGLVLAWAGRGVIAAAASGKVALVDRIQLDETVLVFTLMVCVATTVLFGLLPAAGLMRAKLDRGTRSQTAGKRHAGVLRALVVSQVAVTVILLTGAALVLQSLSRLLSVDTGYQRRQVVAADVLLYERAADVHVFFRQVHERLRSLPGVQAVGLIQSTPLTGKWTFRERIRDVDVPGSFVAFDYFDAMGIPVLAGRTFTAAEYTAPDPPSIIINDVAARLFFPAGDAVGSRVEMFGRPREIVGVVKGTRDVRLDAPAEPQWYQPIFFGSSQLLVRTSGDPAAFVETLRRELIAADPRVIVKRIEALDAIVDASVFERRAATQLLSVFAGLALTLALVGLYGVLNFTTLQRRREFGVRAALGAQRRDLVGMVLRQGLVMTIAGIALGALASIPLAGTLKSFLFEIRAGDPLTMILTSLALVTAALSACALPAWRAASVDPSITLRNE